MVKAILIIGVILLVVHMAWVFASPVVNKTMLEGRMKELATNRGMKGEHDLLKDVQSYAEERKIPVPPHAFFIEISGKKTLIAARYTQEAEYWFLHHRYDFTVGSSEEARRRLSPTRSQQPPQSRAQ